MSLTLRNAHFRRPWGFPEGYAFEGFLGKQPSDEPAPWPSIKTSGKSLASSTAAAPGMYLNNQLQLIQTAP